MHQTYTAPQLAPQMAALAMVFPQVLLADAATGAVLDPVTLAPDGAVLPLPALDGDGRAWQPTPDLAETEALTMRFFQAVEVEGRACVLAVAYPLPEAMSTDDREATAFRRMLRRYRDEVCRDYVTGAFNNRYLEEVYFPQAAARAAAGQPLSLALARVNEYAHLCAAENAAAADRCLNTAAGILRTALPQDWPEPLLARLHDGVFAVAADVEAAALEKALTQALARARKMFSVSLSRRESFTVDLGVADWREADGWQALLALAGQRLGAGA